VAIAVVAIVVVVVVVAFLRRCCSSRTGRSLGNRDQLVRRKRGFAVVVVVVVSTTTISTIGNGLELVAAIGSSYHHLSTIRRRWCEGRNTAGNVSHVAQPMDTGVQGGWVCRSIGICIGCSIGIGIGIGCSIGIGIGCIAVAVAVAIAVAVAVACFFQFRLGCLGVVFDLRHVVCNTRTRTVLS